ncbi:MAG: hypothetical protein JWQ07_890 [Ramlibacter sp.]|nr:hypothetical protein [Ramlibacter sp.]
MSSNKAPDEDPKEGSAKHGTPSEVSWNGGKGRQPYANRGPEEAAQTGGGEDAEGDRGELSGRNLDQLDEAKKKP